MGKDGGGKPIRWRCPQTCRGYSKRVDPFGCHGPVTPDLSERFPQKFAEAPARVTRCPWRMISDGWDAWLEVVLGIYRDREAGAPTPGWPEAYSAATVDAIRYLEAESRAAEAAMWDDAQPG